MLERLWEASAIIGRQEAVLEPTEKKQGRIARL